MDSPDRRARGKLNKTQRSVLLGVATVAGLGVVGKLVSLLTRENPSIHTDEDVATLESVLKEEQSRNLPLQARVQRTKLANLDNDEPDHEVENSKRTPKRSKYADSFSEIVADDDITNEGEIYVNQDPVGHKDRPKELRPGEHSSSSRSRLGQSHSRDDSSSSMSRKGKQESVSDGGGFRFKGVAKSNGGENHEQEDFDDESGEERLSNSPPHRAREGANKKGSTSPSPSGSSEKTPSTQKKQRRAAEEKKGRKVKAGGEEKSEKRKSKIHAEVLFDEAGRWESVNGYKVLRASTSQISSSGDSSQLLEAAEMERAETEKAQSIWDGKVRTRKHKMTEGSKAYLQIKASVVSSVSDAEETPEGTKVREVVKRSTLLPIPSGDESEVHSSVYNVRETKKGLAIEEVVTRTKLLPAQEDFALSDQQLLNQTFSKKTSQNMLRMLPGLLRFLAVLVTGFSVLLILFSRERIPFPFFY